MEPTREQVRQILLKQGFTAETTEKVLNGEIKDVAPFNVVEEAGVINDLEQDLTDTSTDKTHSSKNWTLKAEHGLQFNLSIGRCA